MTSWETIDWRGSRVALRDDGVVRYAILPEPGVSWAPPLWTLWAQKPPQDPYIVVQNSTPTNAMAAAQMHTELVLAASPGYNRR